MGAYLSEPQTEKSSCDESNDFVVCGVSSMQGWRVTQEDAHNAVLKFDDGSSLFAVYDGHGGHEVAAYCSQHLPKYIRETEAYKKGDYIEALKEAFLGFDATLVSPEVIAILKEIAASKDEDGSASEDDDNVNNLHEEATMPIEQVLAKYQSDASPAIRKLQSADGKLPPSPLLKGRRSPSNSFGAGPSSSGAGCSSSSDGPSGSSAGGSGSGSGSSSADCSSSAGSSSNDQVSSSSTNNDGAGASAVETSGNDDNVPDTQSASPDVGSSGDVESKKETEVKKEENNVDEAVSSNTDDTIKQNGKVDSTVKKEVNGDLNHDVKEESDSTSKNEAVSSSSPSKDTPLKNGDVAEGESPKEVRVKGKGKAKDKSPRPDPESKEESPKEVRKARKARISTLELFRSLMSKRGGPLDEDDEDSDETEDEEDTTFDGGDADSSDEGEVEDEDDDEDDDEDEEDEDEESEDDSMDEEDDEDCDLMKMTEDPGADSGCTAVVALLKGKDLYVANAGDSRCVVSRNGKAIDMSLDHKPEDGPEMERIIGAGGKVTCDGRVNGGLNLSRAIGDHAYKLSKDLPATAQMITALPDVHTLRIDPDQDEFMVLACDGIWNFLTSQEVVDFVRTRLKEGKLKVSQICEELFDHCLAPNTLGDGTGCDNMTAVIVQFRPDLSKAPSSLTKDSILESPICNDSAKDKEEKEIEAQAQADEEEMAKVGSEVTTSNSLKRAAPSDVETANGADSPQQEKRPKTENSESASVDSEAVAVQV